MPRTVWTQSNPRLVSDARWTSPYHLRGCAEEFHHEILRKVTHLPFTVHRIPKPSCNMFPSPSQQLSRPLEFRSYNSNQSCVSRISHLNPEQSRIFCWKDCAVYGLGSALGGQDSFDILDRGYRAWFPRRASDRDVSDGNFWGICLRFQPGGGGTAREIWRFHKVFCEQLKMLATGIEASTMGNWEIRDSFEEVVMLVHEGWKDNGVRLVWRNEDVVGNYIGFGKENVRPVDEEVGLREVECSLEAGMRIVASRDSERRGKKEAWNELLEETLIDGEDNSAM